MSKKANPQGKVENPKGRIPKPEDFEPVAAFKDGRPRCTAWARSAGRQCRQRPKQPGSKCRYHGGAGSGRPPISGRYTKLAGLQGRVERALGDGQILDLTAELAILGVHADDLLGQAQEGESRPDWPEVEKTARAINAALRAGNQTQAVRAANHLLTLANQGNQESEAWAEITQTFLAMDRIARNQSARELEHKGLVPFAQVVQVLAVFQSLMFYFLKDPDDRQEFLQKFRKELSYEVEPKGLEAYK